MQSSQRFRFVARSFVSISKRTCSSTQQPTEDFTHFGFQTVKKADKQKLVEGVFHKAANTYDLMNDVMSAGLHRLWKDDFITMLSPTANMKLLDVAGGTGDIGFRFMEQIKNLRTKQNITKGKLFEQDNQTDNKPQLTILDINNSMLQVGKSRAEEKGFNNIEWVTGDAQELPFEENTFDAYTIAFGIRNCTDVPKVVREAFRVLKKGGRFMCLEFSEVNPVVLKQVYDLYSFNVIPPLGALIANDWHSYQYLVESIRQFPKQQPFADMIKAEGFSHVNYTNLTFGVVAVHSGFKL